MQMMGIVAGRGVCLLAGRKLSRAEKLFGVMEGLAAIRAMSLAESVMLLPPGRTWVRIASFGLEEGT